MTVLEPESPVTSGNNTLFQMCDAMTPWAVRVAATLRLADRLRDGAKPLEILAAEAGADIDALGRLLRFLVCRGLFTETAPTVFGLNEAAELLLDDHPLRLRMWNDLDGPAGWMEIAHNMGLLETVRTGKPSYASIFGQPFWEHLNASGRADEFDQLLNAWAAVWVPEVVDGYNWASARWIVDVGGGSGMLLNGLLQKHGHLHATLLDQAHNIQCGRTMLSGVAARTEFVVASFFNPLPPGADIYVLAQVLHDWNDNDASAILTRCAEAAESNGRVVVIDRVGIPHEDAQNFTYMDLKMMVVFGGRERTKRQFAELGARSGLTLRSTKPLPVGLAIAEFIPHAP